LFKEATDALRTNANVYLPAIMTSAMRLMMHSYTSSNWAAFASKKALELTRARVRAKWVFPKKKQEKGLRRGETT